MRERLSAPERLLRRVTGRRVINAVNLLAIEWGSFRTSGHPGILFRSRDGTTRSETRCRHAAIARLPRRCHAWPARELSVC
jgi:hypothetical protein